MTDSTVGTVEAGREVSVKAKIVAVMANPRWRKRTPAKVAEKVGVTVDELKAEIENIPFIKKYARTQWNYKTEQSEQVGPEYLYVDGYSDYTVNAFAGSVMRESAAGNFYGIDSAVLKVLAYLADSGKRVHSRKIAQAVGLTQRAVINACQGAGGWLFTSTVRPGNTRPSFKFESRKTLAKAAVRAAQISAVL